MTRILAVLALSLACVAGTTFVAAGIDAAHADIGSGSSVTPADQLHDPVVDPLGALDDVRAAKKIGWPLALLAGLVMVVRGLQTAASRWPSVGALAWLGTGVRAVVLAGVATVSAAAYNSLALGGTWFAVAVAAVGAALWLLAPARAQQPGMVA
jgi:hypothetical protein